MIDFSLYTRLYLGDKLSIDEYNKVTSELVFKHFDYYCYPNIRSLTFSIGVLDAKPSSRRFNLHVEYLQLFQLDSGLPINVYIK